MLIFKSKSGRIYAKLDYLDEVNFLDEDCAKARVHNQQDLISNGFEKVDWAYEQYEFKGSVCQLYLYVLENLKIWNETVTATKDVYQLFIDNAEKILKPYFLDDKYCRLGSLYVKVGKRELAKKCSDKAYELYLNEYNKLELVREKTRALKVYEKIKTENNIKNLMFFADTEYSGYRIKPKLFALAKVCEVVGDIKKANLIKQKAFAL